MSHLDAWFVAVSEELITYGADAAPSPDCASRAGGGASRGAGSRDVVEVADTDSDIEVIADDGAAVRKRAAAALARSKLPVDRKSVV